MRYYRRAGGGVVSGLLQLTIGRLNIVHIAALTATVMLGGYSVQNGKYPLKNVSLSLCVSVIVSRPSWREEFVH